MNFGIYYIGQPFDEIKNGLTEISEWEYSHINRIFNDEKMFYSEYIEGKGRLWKLYIGTTRNRIFQISLQTTYYPTISDVFADISDEINEEVNIFPKKHKINNSEVLIWETGSNIIMLHNDVNSFADENVLLLTESKIRNN